VLPHWCEREVAAMPQDESLATYCSLLKKEDGHLKLEMTATEAERATRAYNPWPGAFVQYRGERLAIWAAHVAEVADRKPAGSLMVIEKCPAVTFSGGALVLDEVQRAGSRRLPGEQFMNGERGELPPTVGLA
jgi:methionyl-tRNA formyltransferase